MKQIALVVELAESEAAREQGLAGRQAFGEGHGMLFLFDTPTAGAFWNARTYLPLDLAFVDTWGRIVEIQPMRTIHETDSVPEHYAPHAPYAAALETQRGLLERSGVPLGAEVTLLRARKPSPTIVLIRWSDP